MDLSKIVSISGKSGLFIITAQGKHNVVVESLLDGKRFPAFVQNKMSSLEEISIFTTNEDVPLKVVFKNIHEKIGDVLDFDIKKLTEQQLKAKFQLILPDYNEDAVYSSDMKKVFAWYQLLMEKNLLDFTEEAEKKETDVVEEDTDKTKNE